MKNTIRFLFSICLLNAYFPGCMADDRTVYLRGSSTLAPLAQRVAEAYMQAHPDSRILIDAGGSTRGYESVLDGTADIAMTSDGGCSVLADECKANPLLKPTVVGDVIINVLVNKSNAVDDLTTQQLRDIFTGRLTSWKGVGGDDEEINVYLSSPGGGISSAWKKLIFRNEDSYTPKSKVKNNKDLLNSVANDKNAISFAVYDVSAYRKIKTITVSGMSATDPGTGGNQYPLRTKLALVARTRAVENASSKTSKFIIYFVDYVRRNPSVLLMSPGNSGDENE